MSENLRQYYLQTIGIDVWLEKNKSTKPMDSINQPACALNESSPDNLGSWSQLEQEAKSCKACPLHQSRHHVVFGVGNQHADLMVIGEAPGFYEDQKGEPFVGAAGQLLNKMLAAIGLVRQDIYIANVLKCRPPNNRDPSLDEIKQCTPFLERQVELIQPKVMLALGRVSAHYLLGINSPMGQLRGQVMKFGPNHIPLLVTYHPAYLLRNARDKSKSYRDLLQVKSLLT